MKTVDLSTTLTVIECGKCCGVYAIGRRHFERCRSDALNWTCPYCKVAWGFSSGKTDLQLEQEKRTVAERRLAVERARHDQTRADRDHVEARRRGEKAAKTRMKNRVAAGVCPCCNRTFKNLQRHMAGQHPEFASADGVSIANGEADRG